MSSKILKSINKNPDLVHFENLLIGEYLRKEVLEYGLDTEKRILEKVKSLISKASVVEIVKREEVFIQGSVRIYSLTQKYKFRSEVVRHNKRSRPILIQFYVSFVDETKPESELDKKLVIKEFLKALPDASAAKHDHQETSKKSGKYRKVSSFAEDA